MNPNPNIKNIFSHDLINIYYESIHIIILHKLKNNVQKAVCFEIQ